GGNDSSIANEDDTAKATDPSTGVPSSSTKVSNDELVKSANEDATATQSEATDLDNQKDRAYNYAKQLNEQAKAKTAEATKAKTEADAMPDGPDKITAEQRADDLQAQANSLQTQTSAATSIAQALENDAKNKQAEADKAKQLASSLDKAVKSNDSKAIDAALMQQRELQAMSDTRPEAGSTAKNIQVEADKKHAELDKAKTADQDLKDEIAQNQQRIDQLKAEEAKEKDPELKKGIESQIEGINEDIDDDKKQLAAQDKKVQLLQNQANDLDNQQQAANDAIAQSKNPAISSDAITDADKKALSTDAVSYQQSVSETTTSKTYSPVANTQSTGTQSTGTQVTDTQSTGTQSTGTQVTDTQSTGTQSTGTQVTDTQSTGTQSTGTQTGNDSNTVVAENENPDASYTNAIQKTDTITDPVQREKAKAQVYTDWATTIDDQIKEKKQEIAGTTDKTKKTQLNADLKKLQAESNQKKQDSKNSIAAADKAQKEKDAQGTAQPVVSNDDQFTKQITAADQEPDVVKKENTKAQVYSDWADSLDAKAAAKELAAKKIKNKAQLDKANQEIAAIRSDADTKRNLADEAKNKATEAETAAQTQTTPQLANTDVKYDDPQATKALDDQKLLTDQANQNRANKDSLTSLAASATGDQKTQLLKEATDQQRQAWDKD
ncbi:MAG TPA: hypothetical protein VFJ43_10905, partial [Bacteroidia bacterium]|nr:hypothetical protein [Bacteroidia bacterium]